MRERERERERRGVFTHHTHTLTHTHRRRGFSGWMPSSQAPVLTSEHSVSATHYEWPSVSTISRSTVGSNPPLPPPTPHPNSQMPLTIPPVLPNTPPSKLPPRSPCPLTQSRQRILMQMHRGMVGPMSIEILILAETTLSLLQMKDHSHILTPSFCLLSRSAVVLTTREEVASHWLPHQRDTTVDPCLEISRGRVTTNLLIRTGAHPRSRCTRVIDVNGHNPIRDDMEPASPRAALLRTRLPSPPRDQARKLKSQAPI